MKKHFKIIAMSAMVSGLMLEVAYAATPARSTRNQNPATNPRVLGSSSDSNESLDRFNDPSLRKDGMTRKQEQDHIGKLTQEIQDLKNRLETAAETQRNTDMKNASDVEELNKRLGRMNSFAKDKVWEVDALQKSLESVNAQSAADKAEIDELKNQVETLRAVAEQASAQADVSVAEVAVQTQYSEGTNAELLKAQNDLKAANAKVKALSDQIESSVKYAKDAPKDGTTNKDVWLRNANLRRLLDNASADVEKYKKSARAAWERSIAQAQEFEGQMKSQKDKFVEQQQRAEQLKNELSNTQDDLKRAQDSAKNASLVAEEKSKIVQDLEARLKEANEAKANAEGALDAARSQAEKDVYAANRGRLKDAQKVILDKMEDELKNAKKNLTTAQNNADSYRSKLAAEQRKYKDLKDEFENQIQSLKEELSAANAASSNVSSADKADIVDLLKQLEESSRNAERVEKEASELRTQLEQSSKVLDDLRAEREQAIQGRKGAEELAQQFYAERNAVQRERDTHASRADQAEAERDTQVNRVDGLAGMAGDLRKQRDAARNVSKVLQAAVENAEAKRADAEEQVQAHAKTLADTKAAEDARQAEENRLNELAQQVKAFADAKNWSAAAGIVKNNPGVLEKSSKNYGLGNAQKVRIEAVL